MRSPAPGWKGTLPAGVKEYKSPTNIVWLLGRIYCTGTPEDYAAVHKLQDEFKLVPLSSYGKPYTPPAGTVDPSIDMKTAVREQVNRMDAVAYFTLLCKLMKDNPPAAADAPQLAKFARIGIVPGQDFDASKLKADFVKRVPEIGFDRIMLQFKINKDVKDENGWGFTTKTGIYGTDYLMRALRHRDRARRQPAAGCGLSDLAEGWRRQEIQRREQIRHALRQGQLPPAHGFWSLTMYDADYFFVSNPLNRYSISARQNLKTNPDGSTDLYIQKDSPGKDKESNWLAGAGRRFHPDAADVLAEREDARRSSMASWKIPPVKKVA